jgi:hypothetical protein
MMKPLALGGMGRGMPGVWGNEGDHLTNVQCKAIQNYHNNPPYTMNIC